MGNFYPADSPTKTGTPTAVGCCHHCASLLALVVRVNCRHTPVAISVTYTTNSLVHQHRCYGWCGVSVSRLGHGSGRYNTSSLSMTGVVSAWAATKCCLRLTRLLAEICSKVLKLTKFLSADGLSCRLDMLTSIYSQWSRNWCRWLWCLGVPFDRQLLLSTKL